MTVQKTGTKKEKDSEVHVNVKVSASEHKKIKEFADRNGFKLTGLFVAAVRKYIEQFSDIK